jgi:2-iminoacetate synthase
LKEYLNDYASPETKALGEKLINKELEKFDEKNRKTILEGLERLDRGERDVRF